MRPLALLACNENPAYYTCLPMVIRSWHLQNFDVQLFFNLNGETPVGADILLYNTFKTISELPKAGRIDVRWQPDLTFTEVNRALYTQVIRLYMPMGQPEERYCIIGDADMLIGSSFLYRDFDKINVFGHDLTGYGEVPMCYVGMTTKKWYEVMDYHDGNDMQRDLDKYSKYKSADWYEAWGADQQILTQKLRDYAFSQNPLLDLNYINRGTDPRNSGLPLGRWDRHNWVRPTGEIHDVHMLRDPLSDENIAKTVTMLYAVYPNENWAWVGDYQKKLKQIL